MNAIVPATPNEAVRDEIAREIRSHRIVLYMKGNPGTPRCGFSARVCSMLGELGVPYYSRDVLRSADLRDGLKAFSNWPTFPQLYVDAQFVGGCDIVTELFQSGELARMLGMADSQPATPEAVDYKRFRCGIPRQ